MTDESADQPDTGQNRAIIKMRLETDLAAFEQDKLTFLEQLAAGLGTRPEDLWILDVRTGCVFLTIELPADAKRELEEYLASKGGSRTPASTTLDALIEQWDAKIYLNETITAPQLIFRQTSKDTDESRSISWLHLSDVHFKTGEGADSWAQDIVTNRFIRDLPALLEEHRLIPDFIFFTGDLAYSARNDQYQVVSQFLERLHKLFPAPPSVFIVPGNHDIAWEHIVDDLEQRLRRELRDERAVDEHLLEPGKAGDRKSGFLRLETFADFSKNCPVLNPAQIHHGEYYYVAVVECRGLRVGIAGLNSVWRATKKEAKSDVDIDLQHLILGKPQIVDVIDRVEDCEMTIALLHHPPSSLWFADFDRKRHRLLSRFDFVLRGHEHMADALGITSLSGDEWIHLAAGALYTTEWPKGFNAVRIDLTRGLARVYMWEYDEDALKWRKAVETPNGWKEFAIPHELRDRMKRPDSRSAA